MGGGLVEDLYFRNIEVGQVSHAAITIDFNYEEGEKGKFILVVRNFVVKRFEKPKEHAVDVQGFKHAPILNLQLENCTHRPKKKLQWVTVPEVPPTFLCRPFKACAELGHTSRAAAR